MSHHTLTIDRTLRIGSHLFIAKMEYQIEYLNQEMAKNLNKPAALIAGFGQATDTQTIQARSDPTNLNAVRSQ